MSRRQLGCGIEGVTQDRGNRRRRREPVDDRCPDCGRVDLRAAGPEPQDRVGERRSVVAVGELCTDVLAREHLLDAAGPHCRHGQAARQRLRRDHAERLERAGMDEDRGAAHRGGDARAVGGRLEGDGATQTDLLGEVEPALLRREIRRAADETEVEPRPSFAGEGDRPKEHVHALALAARPHP